MGAGVLAVLAGLLSALPAILNLLEGRKINARAKAEAITRRDLFELQSGMRRVDDRVSKDQSVSP